MRDRTRLIAVRSHKPPGTMCSPGSNRATDKQEGCVPSMADFWFVARSTCLLGYAATAPVFQLMGGDVPGPWGRTSV